MDTIPTPSTHTNERKDAVESRTTSAICHRENSDAPIVSLPLDRLVHAWQAQFTGGISPAAVMEAFADWSIHFLNAPGKQAEQFQKAARKWLRFWSYAIHAPVDPKTPPMIVPLPGDRRFDDPDWRTLPFSLFAQGFLFTQQWWHKATTDVSGVSPRHAEIVHFAIRQVLDAMSPSNFLATNPEVLRVTLERGGENLWRGATNWIDDAERVVLGRPAVGVEAFRVGIDVAATPGKVVYRNRLIELIRYAPTAATSFPNPVLIVPAWIMKYYILDLSATNSLVRYLVDRGYDVFMISWWNPSEGDRDLGMDDYLELGALKAIEIVRAIVPGAPNIHAVGYCLGGTLLSIAAAKLAQACSDGIRSLTLFAAQTDFTDAGELMLFINDSQVTWLEDMMWDQGYLDTHQMAGAFQLLRSNDLIWSTMVRQYLLGKRAPMSDLMAWNADATRLPYRMHSEYLRHLFLENDLAAGRFRVRGESVSLANIKVPIFVVSTTRDHIAPWRSVFKITWLAQSDVTMVLASGGHNAGIVSAPASDGARRAGREYRIGTIARGDYRLDPDAWLVRATRHEGSWWPAWANWLEAWSGERIDAARMHASNGEHPPLGDAPGTYVLTR